VRTYNVLFLCTANSARSVIAEAILNNLGRGRFNAFSAGSHPAGKVNPFTIDLLKANNHATENFRSKGWDEFAAPDAPRMDIVITVCDNAAGEVCPVWPGQPATAHWGFADPAAFKGSDEDKRARFLETYRQIATRIRLLLALPMDKLDHLALEIQVRQIGQSRP
jgi:arsenate reductase (thioredoxin)